MKFELDEMDVEYLEEIVADDEVNRKDYKDGLVSLMLCLMDRTSVAAEFVERTLLQHIGIGIHKEILQKLVAAECLLAEAYGDFGSEIDKLIDEVENDNPPRD